MDARRTFFASSEPEHHSCHCTRGSRPRKQERQKPDAAQLDLNVYSLILAPDETGTVPYSCWMGMIKSSINVVE